MELILRQGVGVEDSLDSGEQAEEKAKIATDDPDEDEAVGEVCGLHQNPTRGRNRRFRHRSRGVLAISALATGMAVRLI